MEKNKVFIFSLVTVFAVSLVVLFVNSISVQAVKSGSCQSGATTYCGQQDPVNGCWCDSYAIGYGDNCADIQTVCPDVTGVSTTTSSGSGGIKTYSESELPSYCEGYGSVSDSYCDDTEANCASGYVAGTSDPACMECTIGKWSDCNTGGITPKSSYADCNYVYQTVPYAGYVTGQSKTWSISGLEFSYPVDKCPTTIKYNAKLNKGSGCDASATTITPESVDVIAHSGITQDVFSLTVTRSPSSKICNVGLEISNATGVISVGNFTVTSFVALGNAPPVNPWFDGDLSVKGLSYGNYYYYSSIGSSGGMYHNKYFNPWALIRVVDKQGKSVDDFVISKDETRTSVVAQTKVTLLDVLAYPHGTIVYATIGIEPV